jgi:molecular chaperone IbpA
MTAIGLRSLSRGSRETISITFQVNLLTVTGRKQDTPAEGYLHRGIASRPFEHRFELADHVRVDSADLSNGLLTIGLVREIPEEMKPRKISIESAPALGNLDSPAQIEGQRAA